MMKKHAVLIGVVIGLILMGVAIGLYPGGTMFDETTVGFSWSRNFISNLFGARALNGAPNPAMIWAYAGMLLFPCCYALFFVHMAGKIPVKNAGIILKYLGLANVVFTFLTVTRYHDLMLIISTSLFWTCIVIITVYILKTKLHWFKFLCIICVLLFYYGVYLWGTSNWDLLPTIQKVNFATSTLLILALEYFTKAEDFANVH
ncbi:hypothetical protein [Mucilaginibacter ginsenosidivorax]|uniref:DUF998 domain-containing protein n=1 Tax=Mucilaginibacter ginsenosidivorax TaxID=862126 RepID=A0A5B8W3E1_9SPHI|nr:hypothetical protein [Mucilaginibacter ginsenosidivorax]QEC77462.1 hypothetical protein FSB76_16480 [Mucilaginibacter ginsenosidivorax]